ncbi:MAG: hypothetical protein EAZ88_07550 [Oscillatoriales cyanobacterium]|nr:MAG: hypothetical protein EAZ88_07550 [Oscillatoriales cyanobacterium]
MYSIKLQKLSNTGFGVPKFFEKGDRKKSTYVYIDISKIMLLMWYLRSFIRHLRNQVSRHRCGAS